MKKVKLFLLFLCVFFSGAILSACSLSDIIDIAGSISSETERSDTVISLDAIPEFSGDPYVEINGNQPDFPDSDKNETSFETYSPQDSLQRCGVAYANIGEDLMPTEKRGNISHVKPSGWNSVRYDNVEGHSLYNRCHLIGFQLTGENANRENLITGTRYLNTEGMLPFENQVAEYIKKTGNHVLYRVTPVFEGENLVASGVRMEGLSVEDDGEGICFHIYAYNCQPGIEIDYKDGSSHLAGEDDSVLQDETKQSYVINNNTKKFHTPSCPSAADTSDENKKTVKTTRSQLIDDGYTPCGRCKP